MNYDKAREGWPGEDWTIAADCGATANKAEGAPASQPALCLNDEVRAYLRGMVTELEEFGGISVERVKAIAYGEQATNGELELLGYVFVELLHAIFGSTDASRGPSPSSSQGATTGPTHAG